MPVRHEYRLSFAEAPARGDQRTPADVLFSAVSPAGLHPLAGLMLDAYRGTIDYEGETLSEAVLEVEQYFTRASRSPSLSQCSVALARGESLTAACLIEFWERRRVPFVAFVMTRSTHQRKGLAAFALQTAINRLRKAGESEVWTIITEGNLPSEILFTRAGFRRVESQPDSVI